MNLPTLLRAPSPTPAIPPLHCTKSITTTSYRNPNTENHAIWGQNLNYSIKTKQGGILPILNNCSIQIPSGQLWMLLGPNGCGKSTLLKILAGLLKTTDGNIYVKKPKSFVFQNPDHQVVMPTVEADVAFGLGKFDLTYEEVKSRVAKALDAVGMSEYSQRVAIAGALAEACKVLLLDELTTFLDESDQLGVVKAVKNSLTSSGEVTALWVTHRLEELEYADGAIYMEDGRVVMDGDPSTILEYINRQQALYINQINS
ncbi:ABC transporter I family member 10 [Bienertia sinuspersici]